MGRVISVYDLVQSILLNILTSIMGVAAQVIPIQTEVIIGIILMVVLSFLLCILSLIPTKKELLE